jgi:glycosyltransferase involved in cell wall biosynthesis
MTAYESYIDSDEAKEHPRKLKLSVVIPCYRSEHMIPEVVDGVVKTIATRSDEFDYEIILVNDASPDNTLGSLHRLAKENPRIVVLDLARNFGQFPALMAGFSRVSGDIVVVMDDDMQCPPEEMFKLVDVVVKENKDIVYARYPHREHAAWRNWGSKFNTWCVRRFCNVPKDLQINNYYAVKRYVVDNALRYRNAYPYIDGLLIQSVKTYANVDINHHAREEGSSGYHLKNLVSQWSDGVLQYSIVPLRVATGLGFIVALVGLIAAIVLFIRALLFPDPVEGWASLMVAILFFSGLTIFVVGMVGEYVGRAYQALNSMPQYIVRNSIDNRPDQVKETTDAAHPVDGRYHS